MPKFGSLTDNATKRNQQGGMIVYSNDSSITGPLSTYKLMYYNHRNKQYLQGVTNKIYRLR